MEIQSSQILKVSFSYSYSTVLSSPWGLNVNGGIFVGASVHLSSKLGLLIGMS